MEFELSDCMTLGAMNDCVYTNVTLREAILSRSNVAVTTRDHMA